MYQHLVNQYQVLVEHSLKNFVSTNPHKKKTQQFSS